MRRRAAIFISGRGSNMTALLTAMKDPAYPAEAALVFSNNPDAPGLRIAAEQGVATAHVDHRPFKGDRPAFEEQIGMILKAHEIDLICLAGFMRILTGPFVNGEAEAVHVVQAGAAPLDDRTDIVFSQAGAKFVAPV